MQPVNRENLWYYPKQSGVWHYARLGASLIQMTVRFLLSFDLGLPEIHQGYEDTCQEGGGIQWDMESTGHTVRVQLSSPFPNASWPAHHTKQKKWALFSFSRQLVIQTSQMLYKQGWLMSATADVYTMWPASSSVTLDPWPWNNGIVFFISPCLMRPHWGKVAILSSSQP